MQLLNSNTRNNCGTAVISLLFSSTLRCPKTKPFSSAQALTTYFGFLSAVSARRSALPSIATISSGTAQRRLCVQFKNASRNSSGSKALKTRLKVSCEGIPLGRDKNVLNQSSLAFPKSSISLKVSARHSNAQIAITRMSINS
jgi:hypothetical protein